MTQEELKDVFKILSQKPYNRKKLSKELGVSVHVISKARAGENYKLYYQEFQSTFSDLIEEAKELL